MPYPFVHLYMYTWNNLLINRLLGWKDLQPKQLQISFGLLSLISTFCILKKFGQSIVMRVCQITQNAFKLHQGYILTHIKTETMQTLLQTYT